MASPSFARSREGNAGSAQQRVSTPREGEPQQPVLEMLDYEPITQIRARNVKFFRAETEGSPEGCPPVGGAYGSYNWGQLTQKEIKSLLSNYSQWTTSYRIDASGNVESLVPVARGRVDKGRYRINIDFLRYMTQTVFSDDTEQENQILGRCVVGVGLRTVCEIQTFSTSAEFSLLAFTAKASVNQAAGNIRFDSIGIFNEQVASLMPTNVALDESGIVQAAAATAAIRGLMNMEETILVPHVIAVQPEQSVTNKTDLDRLIDRVSQG